MSSEAMKQALEALGSAHPRFGIATERHQQAITALRAALDAPEPDYERGFVDGMQEQMKRSVDRAVRAMSAKPMTKQEWMAFLEKAVGEFDWEAAGHKREWQGLTDGEIANLVECEDWYHYTEEFVRTIEAKLKEKNT